MKIQNVGLDNAYAIVRGWVSDLAAAATGLISVTDETTGTTVGPVSSMTLIGQLLNDGGNGNLVVDVQAVLTEYTNNSGVDLVAGDVVVIDSSADLAITTTTTAQDTRPVGIVLGPIGAGGTGPVQTAGIVQSINVTASVTRGEYAETSTTAKKATENAARRAGSFGIYLEAGTTPAVLLFGITDGSNSTSTTVGGNDVVWPQGVAMPSWVKPSGSGVITADAQGRIGVMTGTGYKSFPGMAFLEGRLHLVYRTGSAHNSSGATIDYKYSDDLGHTWSTPGTARTLISSTGSNDVRDPHIIALSSGRLLIGYLTRNPYNSTNIAENIIYSDNRGQTWSSPYTVPAVLSGTEAGGTSQPIELPDGTILIPGNITNPTVLECVVWKSTDGGLTFPTQITVASNPGVREYAELQIRLLASGTIVGLMRSDTNQHTWRTVSTDGGLTWSAPADVLTASGRPDFVEFFPSALIFFGRNNNSQFYARWAVSWDEGLTWTALQNVDNATDVGMYNAPVVLAPGYLANLYSLENSGSDADLYLRYYYDGYGTDSIGNVLALIGGALISTTAPTSGQVLTATSTSAAHWAAATAGTVTSVALTVPAEFSVSGSPITGAGTLAVTKANETANQVWAGPTSGSAAAPTFRALVAADIPAGVGTTDHEHVMNLWFSGDGATTAFELPAAAFDSQSVRVWVSGTLTDVTLSGAMLTTMTFGSAPASATNNIVVDLVAAAA